MIPGGSRINKHGHEADYLILFCFWFLVLFGLVMLASASSNLGRINFGDSYYYLKHQILYGFLPGLVGFFLASRIYYGRYRGRVVSVLFLLATVVLVCLVFTPLGFSAQGATRWLRIGPITIQPSEFLKLALVFYLASWLSQSEHRQHRFKEGVLPFFIILGIIGGILVLQHSTSPVAIFLLVSLIMYFVSGGRMRYVVTIIGIGILALALVIALTGYRSSRIISFLNPEADPYGKGFQLLQSQIAIGSGGLTGVGYGQSTIKYRLPEPIGDSIFAVIAEELGFVGSVFLVGLFLFLVLRILFLARSSRDKFAQLLLTGFGSLIGIQAFVNIGAMSGFLPLTGTPLPLISYGGTALMVFMTMMGVIINTSKYN